MERALLDSIRTEQLSDTTVEQFKARLIR